ncbi:MAG: BatD family protein [Gallionella sp.]|nr:BatD family protein [Gallionella sp.]
MNNINRIFLALVFTTFALPALASVTASLDQDHVASGQTVQLQLQHDGTTDSQPDLGPLRNDFDVLGSSSGSNVQIINGHMSSQTQVTVLLSPKHDGKILIPPLQWDGQQTAALELTVGGPSTGQSRQTSGDASSHIFLTTTLDQKQPYVQAADVLTVRLYADQPIFRASLDLPASSDVLVKQIGKDKQSTELRNGHSYQVVERKYLLFPQRSGSLRLDGPVLDAQVQATGSNNPFGNDPAFGNIFGQMPLAGMLNATRPIRLHGKTIMLNVLKRPAAATGANWLPAQNVTLQETWRPDSGAIHVGDPVTRHLQLTALGLTGAQLPDLGSLMQVPDGIKTYPDQSTAKDAIQGDTVLGTRDQDIALIASRPGRFELPEVKLNWWDTVHNVQHVVTLPARVLDILPAAGGSTAPPPPQTAAAPAPPSQGATTGTPIQVHFGQGAESRPWIWLSAALALLWVGTLFGWWYTRRRAQPAQPEKTGEPAPAAAPGRASAFKAFKHACLNNDPHAARKNLLAWAVAAWPDNPPAGLNELSRRVGGPALMEALRQLDRACYMDESWHGSYLAKLLSSPPEQSGPPESREPLPELYS